jgi:3-dehydroquinate dehydratase / shikimate dehydrogenase
MICISIYQESRRFALVDMLNAARQSDLLEIRLDHFAKDPEVGELIQAKPKPLIFSCRRPQDGGDWDGSEDERQALLRNCIVAGADYVELELDIAAQIRKYGATKRVVSYTNLENTPPNIAEIYAEAQGKNPDVIKLMTRAETPEEAWPLVQILAKPAVPTVVVGLGPSSAMLTMLARRIGAPWTYAALERGMEAYPGQLTVETLKTVFHHQDVGKTTRFVGVLGSSERDRVVTALVNGALAHLALPQRCLPLEVGNIRMFRKIADAVKLQSVVVDAENREALRDMIGLYQGSADLVRAVDLIHKQGDQWQGCFFHDRAVVTALNAVLKQKHGDDNALKGRIFMICGVNRLSQAVAHQISKQGGLLIITDRNRTLAAALAQELKCRVIQYEALYSTLHDVLIFGGEAIEALRPPGEKEAAPLHMGYLRSGMCVVDLQAPLRKSTLLREAQRRSCLTVHPIDVLLGQVDEQIKTITGKQVPPEILRSALNQVFQDDEEEE